jgi:hypothetical protein
MPDAAAEAPVMIRWWEVRAPARGPLSTRDGWFSAYASDCPRTPHPTSIRVRYVVTPDVAHHYCSAQRTHKLVALDVEATWREGERPSDEDVDAWEDLLLRCDVPDVDHIDRWRLISLYSDDTDQMAFQPGWDVAYIGEWDAHEHPDDGEQEAAEAAFADWRV